MDVSIPQLKFRIDPGYTFDAALNGPSFERDNLLVGALPKGGAARGLFLGKPAEFEHGLTSKMVWLDTEGAHAVYVMGKRRSGKTFTLGVLTEGLVSGSWVKRGDAQAVLLLDTMNVFATSHHTVFDVYAENSEQVGELKHWGISQETLNLHFFYPRGTPRPDEVTSTEVSIRPADLDADDWAALFGVDTYSDPIGQLIATIYDKVALEGYRQADGTEVAANPAYDVADMLACLDTCPDMARFESRTQEAVRRRLAAVARLTIFSADGTDPRSLLQTGQASVLLLRDLDGELRSLLVAILTKKIMVLRSIADRYERLAAVCTARLGKDGSAQSGDAGLSAKQDEYIRLSRSGLPRSWIIIDEAHNYLPARENAVSSKPLRKLVNEGRNLGLSIVVATQNPAALDQSIRRNADVLIIHSMSMRDDIAVAEGMVNTLIPDSFTHEDANVTSRVFEQLIRSLPVGYAVVSNDRFDRVFAAKVRPRLTIHGGVEY